MSCQARILDKEFVIPGTSKICYTTKECTQDSYKKAIVDDGSQNLCKLCMRRLMTKGTNASTWYGWFDCEYPEDAHVKFSPWYNKVLEEVACEKAEAKVPQDDVLEKLAKKVEQLTIAPPCSKKEKLIQDIASINTWMKGEGLTKFKEQPKMLKKLIELRAQLKMLK